MFWRVVNLSSSYLRKNVLANWPFCLCNIGNRQFSADASVVSPMHDEIFRDPSKETNLRIQDDKETLRERSKASPSPWNEGDYLDGFLLEKKARQWQQRSRVSCARYNDGTSLCAEAA